MLYLGFPGLQGECLILDTLDSVSIDSERGQEGSISVQALWGVQSLTDGHKSKSRCTAMGLRSLGGQGTMRAWGCDTKPIPRGFPRPAPW